jgi:hypothetical protein
MSDDRHDAQEAAEAQDRREEYVAPALTDLGSFQELTQFGGAQTIDAEGQS